MTPCHTPLTTQQHPHPPPLLPLPRTLLPSTIQPSIHPSTRPSSISLTRNTPTPQHPPLTLSSHHTPPSHPHRVHRHNNHRARLNSAVGHISNDLCAQRAVNWIVSVDGTTSTTGIVNIPYNTQLSHTMAGQCRECRSMMFFDMLYH